MNHLYTLQVSRCPTLWHSAFSPRSCHAISAPICDFLIPSSLMHCASFNDIDIRRQCRETTSKHHVATPADIIFPLYDPKPVHLSCQIQRNHDQDKLRYVNSHRDSLVTDDFYAMFSPLWICLEEKEHAITPSQRGDRFCAACGA